MDPFMAQSAALHQSTSEWQALSAAAGEGRLVLEKGAAEECAKHCEEMIEKLNGYISKARRMDYLNEMGNCNIGRELGAKFVGKATGEANSLVAVLHQHRATLTDMAAAYRAAGRAFQEQENANKAAMQN